MKITLHKHNTLWVGSNRDDVVVNLRVHETIASQLNGGVIVNHEFLMRRAPYWSKYAILSPSYGLVYVPVSPFRTVLSLDDFEWIDFASQASILRR